MYEIIELMSKIDIHSVEQTVKRGLNAFSSSRFPMSLVKTFQRLSERFELPYTEEDSQDVYRIGRTTFMVERALIPGAKEVLDFLHKEHIELLLFTKGDPEVQEQKLIINEIKNYFGETHVVPTKNRSILANVVGTRRKEHVFIVGNSFKSDILPALDLECNAIFIPKETWKFEEDYTTMRLDKRHMRAFDKIIDIRDEFQSLDIQGRG